MSDVRLEPLDDADLSQLAHLLARYAANHLDQWDLWRIHLVEGDVDVRIATAPDDAAPTATVIWPR